MDMSLDYVLSKYEVLLILISLAILIIGLAVFIHKKNTI